MATADTARLIASLELKDQFSPGVSSAMSGLGRLEVGMGGIGKTAKAMGGHISQGFGAAIGNVKNLGFAFAGLLGIGGIASLGGILKETLGKMNDIAFATEKLTGLTGASAEKMSALLAVFGKFGVDAEKTAQIVGFAEKTLGKLDIATTATKAAKSVKLLALERRKLNIEAAGGDTKAINLAIVEQKAVDALKKHATALTKLTALEKLYGISLRDSKGHAVDFQTELLRVADYYNSNASASKKAALAATLFGRGYATLIPVLKLGSKGILDAEQAATDLGLTLTKQNVVDLAKYRASMREVGEAVGGLELQIGLGLLPTIIDLTKGVTAFVKGNAPKIIQFFKDGAQWAKDAGRVIQTQVIPVFQGIADAWGKVPSGLQDLLIKGFVVNKLTGGMITNLASDLGKGLIKGVLGMTAGVVNINAATVNGGIGGVPGAAGAAGGGASALVKGAAYATLFAGISIAVMEGLDVWTKSNRNGGPAPISGDALRKAAQEAAAHPLGNAPSERGTAQTMKAAADAAADDARETRSLAGVTRIFSRDLARAAEVVRSEYMARKKLYHQEAQVVGKGTQVGVLGAGGKTNALLVADALAAKFAHSQAPFYQSSKNQERILAAMKARQAAFYAAGDTKAAAKIGKDISTLRAAINARKPPKVTLTATSITTVNVSSRQNQAAASQTWRYGRVISDDTYNQGGK